MTKEVLIAISGVRITDGDPEQEDLTVRGSYYTKSGNHYLLYQEPGEGGAQSRSTIKISPGSMDIMKNGSVRVHMRFEKGKKHVSGYLTPAGELTIGIFTEATEFSQGEDYLQMDLEYSLEINGSHVSDCRIRVSARSVEEERKAGI